MPEELDTYLLMRLGMTYYETQEIDHGVAVSLLEIDATFKRAEASSKERRG